jgi:uncharacterized protein (TIGR02757 family)
MHIERVAELLERESLRRDDITELSYEKPDPLLVASRYRDERISLVCALFAYGNAGQIVRFLDSLDFSLLDAEDDEIRRRLDGYYYRFQKSEDIAALFIAIKRLTENGSIEEIVREGYEERGDIRDGLFRLISRLRSAYEHDGDGYDFLIGRVPAHRERCAPYKRYMMYFRWMVRKDNLDMGLWSSIERRDLIIPLDTHTHKVSLRLGLVGRKSYDMKSAVELTHALSKFDPEDPVRYDFALYRIGQERLYEGEVI